MSLFLMVPTPTSISAYYHNRSLRDALPREPPARRRCVETHIDDDLAHPFLEVIEKEDLREIGDGQKDGNAREAGAEQRCERRFHGPFGQRRQRLDRRMI